jgi:hypothetical protein
LELEIRYKRARCSGCCPESAISCPYGIQPAG